MKFKLNAGLLILFVPLRFGLSSLLAQEQKEASVNTQGEKIEAKPSIKTGWAQKIFQVKYADMNTLNRMLGIFGDISIRLDYGLRAMAVSCPPEIMPAVENAIRRLDVPPPPAKNIELTVYLLSASERAGESTNIPQELQSVTKQLKGVFNYQSFRLLETGVVRHRIDGGSGQLKGVIPAPGPDLPSGINYEISFHRASIIPDEKGSVIRIDDLFLKAGGQVKRSGMSVEPVETNLKVGIDMREGQKVVVGKANLGSDSTNNLIFVVTAKVLE